MKLTTEAQSGVQDTKLKTHTQLKLLRSVLFFCICALGFILYQGSIPTEPKDKLLTVDRGMSVAQITEKASEEHIVRSGLILHTILAYAYDPSNIYAGTYSFTYPYTIFDVAKKLAQNDIETELITLTIPEGTTRKDIATIAVQKNPKFNVDTFLALTKDKEGYLFPETYFVSPEFTAEELVAFFTKTYEEKIAPLRPRIETSSLSEYQILILASLLERETNSRESMKMVAGILENRMNIGMALQVDASLEYILDKPLQELTPEDLKIESPYNTYAHNGLPPTPIGNPGSDAVEAIIDPTPSSYFYYITDSDGHFHYAKTFEEHKLNVQKYLR